MAHVSHGSLHFFDAGSNPATYIASDDAPTLPTAPAHMRDIEDSLAFTLQDPTAGGAPFEVNVSLIGVIRSFDGEPAPVGFLPASQFPPGLQSVYPNGAYVVSSSRPVAEVAPPATINSLAAPTGEIDMGMSALCFLADTRIATTTGPCPVQELSPGDLVITADGPPVTVRWIGYQTVLGRFAATDRTRPVRIRAGAFADGLPERDLCLTGDHAVRLDGVLITASALVNGDSVAWMTPEETGPSYTVYHVETARHEVILAEGVAAETYIDYVSRQGFDNFETYRARFGEEEPIIEAPYPRVTSARLVPPEIRDRLLSRLRGEVG